MKLLWTTLLSIAAIAAASNIEVPYAGGKLAQSVALTLTPGVSPDTIRIGNRFMLRAYRQPSNLTVCGAQSVIALRIDAPVVEVKSMGGAVPNDTNWMSYDQYPSAVGSMMSLDSIGPVNYSAPEDKAGWARGFAFAADGERNDCTGATWSFTPQARQVVFVTANGAYAKLKIVSYQDSVSNPTPSLNYGYLTRVTIRMVVNTSAADLVDPNPPVSLRPPMKAMPRYRSKAAVKAFYNPLGINLGREPKGLALPAF